MDQISRQGAIVARPGLSMISVPAILLVMTAVSGMVDAVTRWSHRTNENLRSVASASSLTKIHLAAPNRFSYSVHCTPLATLRGFSQGPLESRHAFC